MCCLQANINETISYQFDHVGFLHWRDSAADDTCAHAAQLYEVRAQRVVQGFGQALAGYYKLVVWCHPEIEEKSMKLKLG